MFGCEREQINAEKNLIWNYEFHHGRFDPRAVVDGWPKKNPPIFQTKERLKLTLD